MTTIRASQSSLWPLPILGLSRARSGDGTPAEPSNRRRHAGRAALQLCAEGISIANPHKIIWIDPDDIVFKTCCDHDLQPNDVKPGDSIPDACTTNGSR